MSEPDYGTFGGRLRFLMEDRRINGLELSKAIGLDDGAISKHRKSTDAPGRVSVEKYVAFFGVSYDWLAYGRGPQRAARGDATVDHRIGSPALEEVLRHFEWPEDIAIDVADKVVDAARREAFADGKDRPESIWNLRLKQLLREFTGRSKGPPVPASHPRDVEQESPEIQEHRKAKRRR